MRHAPSAGVARRVDGVSALVIGVLRHLIPILSLISTTLLVSPADVLAQADMEQVGKGVVRVYSVYEDNRLSSGSGFVLNNQGYIVTNNHVIANARAIKILTGALADSLTPLVEGVVGMMSDGPRDFGTSFSLIYKSLLDATVVESQEGVDFAILKVTGLRDVAPLPIAAANLVKIGQEVRALGYPGSGDVIGASSALRLKVSGGEIKSKEYQTDRQRPVYQLTFPIHHGNSGGPLVTMCGEVVGITTFGRSIGGDSSQPDIENTYYAIQIDPILQELASRNISYSTVSEPCTPGLARDPLVYLALGLAGAGAVLGFTRQGRAAVQQAATSIGRLKRPIRAPQDRPHRQPAVPAALSLMPVLRGLDGPYQNSVLQLDKRTVTIGRDPKLSQVVFPPDAHDVSKNHCTVRFSPGQQAFTLTDSGSTNGTFLDSGERLAASTPHLLRSGERFYLGNRKNLFEVRLEAPK